MTSPVNVLHPDAPPIRRSDARIFGEVGAIRPYHGARIEGLYSDSNGSQPRFIHRQRFQFLPGKEACIIDFGQIWAQVACIDAPGRQQISPTSDSAYVAHEQHAPFVDDNSASAQSNWSFGAKARCGIAGRIDLWHEDGLLLLLFISPATPVQWYRLHHATNYQEVLQAGT